MALNLAQLAEERPWAAELIAAAIGLLLGIILMPVLIFYAGVATLGRFDGASLGHLYSSLFRPQGGLHCLLGGISRSLRPIPLV